MSERPVGLSRSLASMPRPSPPNQPATYVLSIQQRRGTNDGVPMPMRPKRHQSTTRSCTKFLEFLFALCTIQAARDTLCSSHWIILRATVSTVLPSSIVYVQSKNLYDNFTVGSPPCRLSRFHWLLTQSKELPPIPCTNFLRSLLRLQLWQRRVPKYLDVGTWHIVLARRNHQYIPLPTATRLQYIYSLH